MKKIYAIEADCPACAGKMEFAAAGTAGVVSATVNFMSQKLTVDFEEGADPEKVIKEISKKCKKIDDDLVIIT